MPSLSFGVEIELIAAPHKIRHPLTRSYYYKKLAKALREDGINAVADPLQRGHQYRKHPEHYDKWFITKDGSIGNPGHPVSE